MNCFAASRPFRVIIHTAPFFETPINTRIVDNLVDKVEKERG